MLKRLKCGCESGGGYVSVKIGSAEKDAVFPAALEFNAPVHGTWNIVHIGLQVPDVHQIYVCADNCMRGVIMTACEMGESRRFHCVLIKEKDMYAGSLEGVTIDGVSAVLDNMDSLPPAVQLFTVCVHQFLGCDLDYVYRTLREKYPSVYFCRCYMDPVNQKTGPSPDEKLRKAMFDPIVPKKFDAIAPKSSATESKLCAVLGCDIAQSADGSDIISLMDGKHSRALQLQDCKNWYDFISIGKADLFICCYPNGRSGVENLAGRLGRPFLYMNCGFDYADIEKSLRELADALGQTDACFFSQQRLDCDTALFSKQNPDCDSALFSKQNPDCDSALFSKQRQNCDAALANLLDNIGDTPIAIDYTAHSRPLSLARLLLEHGFNVKTVYLDRVSREDYGDFDILKRNYPNLTLRATVLPEMRLRGEYGFEDDLEQSRNRAARDGFEEALEQGCNSAAQNEKGAAVRCLAIGQKAAWFENTRHFVNIVEGGGLFGFSGIIKLAKLMEDAFMFQKNLRDIVQRKAVGCQSLCGVP